MTDPIPTVQAVALVGIDRRSVADGIYLRRHDETWSRGGYRQNWSALLVRAKDHGCLVMDNHGNRIEDEA